MSKKLETGVHLLFWGSLISLVWIFAWKISRYSVGGTKTPSLADQATILFAAASIALFILSTMLAIVAVIGWQTIKDNIRQQVEIAMQGKTAVLEKELRGRVIALFGHTLGMLSTKPDLLEATDPERLYE